jgi:ketosteroid isomerase-like protein
MTAEETEQITLVRAYLAALAAGEVGEALARFFTADALQIEWPNRLNSTGGQSDLAMLIKRSEQGKQLLSKQTYQIRSEIVSGNKAAVEAEWCATLAVPLGSLAAGAAMKAYFAMFFEFKDGRIAIQRNYDCFEPW